MKSLKEQKVVAAYPHPHEVSARFHKSWDALRQYDFANGQRICVGGGHVPVSSGANVVNARNEAVEVFLDRHDADWLWFVDTDMTFEPDTLDRMVRAAHPEKRPILGALCFSLQNGWMAAPTLYTIREDNRIGRLFDYEPGSLMRCLTGTGCLLIHRSVLVAMREKFDKPYQWFKETAVGGLPVGEDITFCVRAESIGIPVHVATDIRCGHEKPFIVDEAMFQAQHHARVRMEAREPTFVVIPTAGDRDDTLVPLLAALTEHGTADEVFLYDNNGVYGETAIPAVGWPLHRMWNDGLDQAEKVARDMGADRWNVAILNDDIAVPAHFLPALAAGLRADESRWVAHPDAGGGFAGWAFMVRGESGLRFDESYEWWYGDTDLVAQVQAAGKTVVPVSVECVHHHPTESTRGDRLEQARRDEARFAAKWGIDPATLYLARHPEFGR